MSIKIKSQKTTTTYNRRTGFVVFLLGNPHLLESRERWPWRVKNWNEGFFFKEERTGEELKELYIQDWTSNPHRVLTLWGCDNFDFHCGCVNNLKKKEKWRKRKRRRKKEEEKKNLKKKVYKERVQSFLSACGLRCLGTLMFHLKEQCCCKDLCGYQRHISWCRCMWSRVCLQLPFPKMMAGTMLRGIWNVHCR